MGKEEDSSLVKEDEDDDDDSCKGIATKDLISVERALKKRINLSIIFKFKRNESCF